MGETDKKNNFFLNGHFFIQKAANSHVPERFLYIRFLKLKN